MEEERLCENESSKSMCLNLKQAYQILAQHEMEAKSMFTVRSSPKNFGNMDPLKARRLYWCDTTNSKSLRREFTGVPFVPLAIKTLECEFGKDRKLKQKLSKLKKSEHDYAESKRKFCLKKRNCPVMCSIKELVEFPEYKTESEPPPYEQKMIWREILGKLKDGEPIEILRRFLVILPNVSAHVDHPGQEDNQPHNLASDLGEGNNDQDVNVEIDNIQHEVTPEPAEPTGDNHLLTLNVSNEQETAIMDMFETRGWDFIPLETHEINIEEQPIPELENSEIKFNNIPITTSNNLTQFPAQTVSTSSQNSNFSSSRGSQSRFGSTPNSIQTVISPINETHSPSKQRTIMEIVLNIDGGIHQNIDKDSLVFGELNKLFDQSLEEVPVEMVEGDITEDGHVEIMQVTEEVSTKGPSPKKKMGRPRKRVYKSKKVSYSNRMIGNVLGVDEADIEAEKPKKKKIECKQKIATKKKKRDPNLPKRVAGQFKCEDCGDIYRWLDCFQKHKKDGRCRFECEQCGKVFTSRKYTSYLVHLKYHAKERAFKCKICEVSFVVFGDYKYHMQKHGNPGPNICNFCGLCFDSVDDYHSHRHLVHNETQRVFKCDICGKKLSAKHAVASHKFTMHSDDLPIECKICGKRFKTLKILQQTHAKVHKNEYSFKCQLPGCRRHFLTSEELTKHMKRHNNIPSRFCDICGQGFYNKKELKIHARIHSEEKTHACPYCDFRSMYAGNLAKHVKTHLKVV